MEQSLMQAMMRDFESTRHETDDGIEFWLARELQSLLWYSKWDNFLTAIQKAKQAVQTSHGLVSDHFADVGKMVDLWSGSQREVPDVMLTRYACYLIAQNGNPRKSQVAFAQMYFATQTRKFELIEEKLVLFERVLARKKLTETEKELSQVIFEQTHSDKNFALIRSKWDAALFKQTTNEMKQKRWIKPTQPLADFMPTILLKAKDFATEITIYNAKQNKMSTEDQISAEHVSNNASVRKTLLERWIVPENVQPEPDIKKIERKLASESKKSLKNSKKLKK